MSENGSDDPNPNPNPNPGPGDGLKQVGSELESESESESGSKSERGDLDLDLDSGSDLNRTSGPGYSGSLLENGFPRSGCPTPQGESHQAARPMGPWAQGP